jgi:ATPase subunit of ABC transporter with duplicated ATPase domains
MYNSFNSIHQIFSQSIGTLLSLFPAVLWLEEYLQRWKKTLIVVSHDRDLLNTVTTDIIHLHDLKLHAYKGNFAQFEEMYDQRRREVNKAFEKYEKQLRAAKTSGKNAKQNQEKVWPSINHFMATGPHHVLI